MILGISSLFGSPVHAGHCDYLEASKSQCDRLLVIVNNDVQQTMKTGAVYMDQNTRLRIVRSLKFVDAATLAVDEDETVATTLEQLALSSKVWSGIFGSDLQMKFFNSGDRQSPNEKEDAICVKYGVQQVFLDLPKVDSSSHYRGLRPRDTQ